MALDTDPSSSKTCEPAGANRETLAEQVARVSHRPLHCGILVGKFLPESKHVKDTSGAGKM